MRPARFEGQPGRAFPISAPTSSLAKRILITASFPVLATGHSLFTADYFHRETFQFPTATAELGIARLPMARKKLQAGEKVRIVAYGDSITAGGEASEPGLIFWERWADALRHKYPRSSVEIINGATGGDATVQGLQRLQEKVLKQKPDLVLIGFGMNDHNRGGVPLNAFAENLRTMIDQIRADTGAEVVLFSAFPPNPKWHYSSHNMEAYAGCDRTGGARKALRLCRCVSLLDEHRHAQEARGPFGQQHQSSQRFRALDLFPGVACHRFVKVAASGG